MRREQNPPSIEISNIGENFCHANFAIDAAQMFTCRLFAWHESSRDKWRWFWRQFRPLTDRVCLQMPSPWSSSMSTDTILMADSWTYKGWSRVVCSGRLPGRPSYQHWKKKQQKCRNKLWKEKSIPEWRSRLKIRFWCEGQGKGPTGFNNIDIFTFYSTAVSMQNSNKMRP